MTDWPVDEWTGTRFPTTRFSAETQRELDAEAASERAEREARDSYYQGYSKLARRVATLERDAVTRQNLGTRIETLCENIGKATGDFVRGELDKLEAKLVGQASVKDRGIWSEREVYLKGELVSDKSSAWLCRAEGATMDRPGTSDAWRLIAKGGNKRPTLHLPKGGKP